MSLRLADLKALSVGLDRLTMWLRRETPQTYSASTIGALIRLAAEGPLRISDLAAREAITQPGVTVLANRLGEAGLAERIPDPTDRRAALVRITDAGRAVLAERDAVRAEVLRARLTEVDETDRQLLLAALPAIERLVATSTSEERGIEK